MKDWRKSPEPPGMMGVGGSGGGDASSPDDSTIRSSVSGSNGQSSRTSPSVTSDLTEHSHVDNSSILVGRLFARTKLSLLEMARRVVAQRIHMYNSFGDAPFRLVRPLLEQCTPQKLWILEESSPHLIAETDYIWRRNCLRDFRDFKECVKDGGVLDEHLLISATHGWREVYRDRMVQDYEAKQAATEHVKQKYALLRASKEASQVRIVTDVPAMRRKTTSFAVRQPQSSLTQGQRMLSKARRAAHTHAQAVRGPLSGALKSTQTLDGRRPGVVAASAGPSRAEPRNGQQSPPPAAGVRRARTPPGFERIASRRLDEGTGDAQRATKRARTGEDTGGIAAPDVRHGRCFASPPPTTPTSPGMSTKGSPLRRGVCVTKRKVTPIVVSSSDEEM